MIVCVDVCACVCVFVWVCEGDGDDRINEHVVRVAGGTFETGQLLIIKRCLCPIALCHYECLNISLFLISIVFCTVIYNEPTKFLQADSGLSLHATLSFV